jgi:hypothetical protein
MIANGVPARAQLIRRLLVVRCCRHRVAFPCWSAGELSGFGRAPVAAHAVAQLGDTRGSRDDRSGAIVRSGGRGRGSGGV